MLLQYDFWSSHLSIILAVQYHNNYDLSGMYQDDRYLSLSPSAQEQTKYMSQVVRDADKLQNLLYMAFDIEGFLKFAAIAETIQHNDHTISPVVRDQFVHNEQIDSRNTKTLSDWVIYYLSWQFQLYTPSADYLLQQSSFFATAERFLQQLGVDAQKIAYISSLTQHS